MTNPDTITPQELADACAKAMWNDDSASQNLGMSLDHVAPGVATLSMTITDQMTNGHGMCHGGYIFTLADSAFAFACNTYNQRVVAQHCAVTYLSPVETGARLQAHAREVSRRGRSGIYDVRVTDGSGAVIAEFRGHSRVIKGTHLTEE
ncbi:hydroxyphenylacetyl-CoA thioesterase PaaI [Roseinatronobacter monicus]|uniref:Acyl-CoA thioesterase n=1 Tax=Roseinatronobacter monicus TaxID=393481 RepID=A0A543KIP1_9RHOB|nr:hydroxyphenylacetyl-CoA thioesterase PaaI [Roseinatronobacter monicus]TQM94950.1 acyl-CoA thioesterase [Roseinatronobacter monicus]